MKLLKIAKNPYLSLLINFVYALGNCVVGFISHSWWFITLGAYYTILTVNRFCIFSIQKKSNESYANEVFAKRITGILLLVMSFCLIGVNILSAIKDRGVKHHEIVMITIAAYTFTKITIAIIRLVKSKRIASPIIVTMRNISFAEAVVSVYSLQRSMLISFPGMSHSDIQLFNILTGTATWIVVLFLGINLIGGKRINMAKSKIANINKKIAKTVTEGYNKIEKGVVDGYKKIEKGVVDGYTKIEDKFVDAYLTKDGETVEQAKERLKKENK